MKNKIRRVSSSYVLLFLAAVVLSTYSTAYASSGSWNIDNNGTWSTASNWNPATVPGTAAGDIVNLIYDITAARTITIDSTSRTVGSLSIGDPGSSYFNYTLDASGGAGLTFDNGGNAASLVQTGNTTASDTISAPLTLEDNLIVTNTATLTVSGEISGSGKSLTKTGSGSLIISGANSYSGGSTIIGGGSVQLGATDTLPVAGTVTLGDSSSIGNLNLGTFSQTFAGLTVLSESSSLNNLITIDAGQSLVINGSSGIFIGTDNGGSSTTKVIMQGGGALVVTNSSANITIGKHQSNQAYRNTSSLDLSDLSSVTMGSASVPVNEIRMAYRQTNYGTLTLSDVNNLLTATTLQVGNSAGGYNAYTGTLILGAGVNDLAINTLNIGVGKANGVMKFASQTAGSPGTVSIGGKTGGITDITIGSKNGITSGAVPTGTLDLRGHTADVTAGTVIIGLENNLGSSAYTGGAKGFLYFDAGTFSINTLTMGVKSGANVGPNAKATATLTIGGGEFTVNNGPLTFGYQTDAGVPGTANATLNLDDGTFRAYADIITGPSNCVSTINLNGGTMDMTGRNIGMGSETVTVFNAQSGTLMNLGEFNNGAPLVKSGSGTLTITGTNMYSGATVISAGTLVLGEGCQMRGGLYTADITNNDTLVFDNSADQTLGGVINGSGTLTKSGNSTLTLTEINTYAGATDVTAGMLAGKTGGSLNNSDVSVDAGAALGVKIHAADGVWSCKSLTLGSGSTTAGFYYYGITPSATTAPLNINGDIVNNGTLNVTISGVNAAVGTYPLISYTGTLTAGTLGSVSLPNGGAGTLVNNTANKTIDLSVSVAGTPLVWDGGSGNWDIATTANWSGSQTYQEGDLVLFDDSSSGTAPFTVTVAVNVAPGGITVNNPTKDYTFAGPGIIGGEGSLTKRGASKLTITGSGTYSGETTLDAGGGTLEATVTSTTSGIGPGPVSIGAGATLQIDNLNTDSYAVFMANPFAGSGSLALNLAAGTTERSTVLSGLSGFAGSIALTSEGATGDKLDVSGADAPDTSVQVANSNTLYLGSSSASFNSIVLEGMGNTEDHGAISLGADATTLAGAITLLGDTTIASDAAEAVLTGNITGTAGIDETYVLTQGTTTSDAGCLLGGVISDGFNGGHLALTQTKGNLKLSSSNTYSGGTIVNNDSSLQIGTTNALPVSGSVTLGSTSGAGNLDLGTFSQTISSLSVVSKDSTANNQINVGAGQTLAVNGSDGILVGVDAGLSSTTRAIMAGGGSLVVTNTSAEVTVGKAQPTDSYGNTATLDLSGLSSVILGNYAVPVDEIRVAYGRRSGGTLTLSDTDNLLVADTLHVANSRGYNPGTGYLTLGAGENILATDTINMGLYKAVGTMQFASQAAGSPGTLTIGGRTRSTTDFVLGSKQAIQSSSTPTGTLDLRGHVANVTAGKIIMAQENNTVPGTWAFGGAKGSILFDAGTFSVTNLMMGLKTGVNTGVNARASATITVNGGEFTVTDGPITLAYQSGEGTADATININGGTFRSYTDIITGPGNCTGTINLDGGTLDMTSQSIGMNGQTVTVFNASSGTLMNLGEFNNGAPLIKTGTGTLSIAGTNTYAGATIVSNGTLRLTSTSCLPPTAKLYLTTGTTTELDYTGRLLINELYIDGVRKTGSLYGEEKLPSYLSGTGFLELPFEGTVIIVR